ncbi:MAG: N-acetylmuramoyl-L-alanine amidase [Vicinamibacterales bacterium]
MHTLLRRLRLAPSRVWRVAVVAVMAIASLAVPNSAAAQTASDLYARAQKRASSAAASRTVAGLRAAVGAYELLVRRYPRSGFCDDALWNGALTARMAWERFQQPADRATATRLLTSLRREYPRSQWAGQAAAQLNALSQRARPAATKPAPAAAAVNVSTTALPPPPPAPTSGVATVRSITKTELPHGERLTIEFDREVVVAPERIANPERVFFDLRNTQFDQSIATALESVTGPRIASVRIGRKDAQTTRLVLALAGAPRHSAYALYHPYRLVVDLEADALPTLPPATEVFGPEVPALPLPVVTHPAIDPRPLAPISASRAPATHSVIAHGLPPAPPAATSNGDYSLARQLGLGISRIVIDAGHGGHDPGAQANGVVESDLVLDIAQRVEKLLKKQPGIDVVLTRRTDTFIPLEERTAIANREGADLFLSIHANASRRSSASGVETYFLNFATNTDAEAVAARENSGSQTSMGKLPVLVQQIALHNKMRESRELAQLVQANMIRGLRSQNKDVVDLGVKQAPFVVLIGAQMPSVLAELSFLTNKPEASLLKKDAYRQRIAQALADAVLKYQTSLKKVITTAAVGGR